MKSQTIANLSGEIAFRKKLSRQHVTGEKLLPDYLDKKEHDGILLDRIRTTYMDVNAIKGRTRLTPFIELGAERCQNALVLTNDFNAEGVAVDISFHQLKTAAHFAEIFNRPKLPLRVCCDVNNLPFRNDSFPFVFCYAFLHHFPTPKPIVQEIYRVLSRGIFFFNEEPFKRPRLNLYRQRLRTGAMSGLRNSKVVRFIEKFLSEDHNDEKAHGIIENDDISLREWNNALNVFAQREIRISSVEDRISTELGRWIAMKNLPNMLLGGAVKGVCEKTVGTDSAQPAELTDLLLCPDCIVATPNPLVNPPPLSKTADSLSCPVCNRSYPVIDDIVLLLPTPLFRGLYPEFAD